MLRSCLKFIQNKSRFVPKEVSSKTLPRLKYSKVIKYGSALVFGSLAGTYLGDLTGDYLNSRRNKKKSSNEPMLMKSKLPIPLSTIATGTSEDIRQLANQYTENDFKEMMKTTTCRGNNPLHLAAQYNTAEVISELVKLLDQKASDFAVQCNNEGIIPVDSINQNVELKKNNEKYTETFSTLLSISKNPPTKKLSELIDENKLLTDRYSHITNEHLLYNLKMAIQAVNEARSVIKRSNTHTVLFWDTLQQKEKEDVVNTRNQIQRMRLFYTIGRFFSLKEGPDLRSGYVMSYQTANCAEFADLVYMNLKRRNLKSPSDIFTITNGDHAFNVIDRLPNSDPNNPKTWGENAVVADAWSGDVYLASEVTEKLKAFRNVTYGNNKQYYQYYLEPFNPHYHKLAKRQILFL